MLRKTGVVISSVALAAALVPGAALAAEEAAVEEPETTSALTVQADDASVSESESSAKTIAAAGEQTISMGSVANGTAEIVSVKLASGTTKTAAELQSAATSEEAYYSNNVFKAPAGSTVTIKLLPARGYQLTTSTIGGNITLKPVDDDEKVGCYTFEMPTTAEGIDLDSVFTAQADTVETDSTVVVSGTIADAGSAITSGTLRLDVSDIDDSDIKKEFNAKASSASNVVAYVDTWLYQVTTQGTTSAIDDVWEDPLDETTSPITVTLKLSDSATSGATQFYIIREYDDNYQQASVTYDASAKTITFKSDKFSSYAIVKGAPPSSTSSSTTSNTGSSSSTSSSSSSSSTPKTGDTNNVTPLAVTSVLAAGVAAYSGRRLRRED